MANTYTQIHLQFVFAVKYREAMIHKSWKEELHRYITGIVNNQDHKMICINSMPDHIHLFIGMRPHQSISEFMRVLKTYSSKWINEKKLVRGKFEWQGGYGAFSYGKSQIPDVVAYIENQEQHHQKKSFKEEYLEFLHKFQIDYDEKYIFGDLL